MPPEKDLHAVVPPVGQAEERQRLVDADFALPAREPVEACAETQVFLRCEVAVERRLLEHDADLATNSTRVLEMSFPATSAEPRDGRRSVVSIRIVVVFPAPFGPRKPKNSPDLISRSIASTAGTRP